VAVIIQELQHWPGQRFKLFALFFIQNHNRSSNLVPGRAGPTSASTQTAGMRGGFSGVHRPPLALYCLNTATHVPALNRSLLAG